MVKPGYKQTEVGVLPETWQVIPLQNLCDKNGIVRGPFGGALKKELFVAEGYKVYEQGNAIYKTIEIIFNIGEAFGSYIRRKSEGKMCDF